MSQHADSLATDAKRRYIQKISLLDGYDPLLGVPARATGVAPPVNASDLVSYLILETSFITAKQFKARKGLEAYNQFVCGWVKLVKSFVCGSKHVNISRVRHSRRFSHTPLHSWIITKPDGEVCCAHCNCMAGLGETCTHVAATLFYLEAAHRLEERTSCTSQAYQWTMPTFQKNGEYSELHSIDYSSASGKLKRAEMEVTVTMTGSATSSRLPGTSLASRIKPPSAAEEDSFFCCRQCMWKETETSGVISSKSLF